MNKREWLVAIRRELAKIELEFFEQQQLQRELQDDAVPTSWKRCIAEKLAALEA